DDEVFLKWNAAVTDTHFPAAWVTGYDIYRASPANSGMYAHINITRAVQPLPATTPLSNTAPLTGPLSYEEKNIDYYFADQPPSYGDWLYRVAPRDLLAQVRQWPANAAQFSDALAARAYDYQPPSAPFAL